jgi:hypothetical protein
MPRPSVKEKNSSVGKSWSVLQQSRACRIEPALTVNGVKAGNRHPLRRPDHDNAEE